MKQRIEDMSPGTWFRSRDGGSILVRLEGAVGRGCGDFLAANIMTGALACLYIPGTTPEDTEYEIVEKTLP